MQVPVISLAKVIGRRRLEPQRSWLLHRNRERLCVNIEPAATDVLIHGVGVDADGPFILPLSGYQQLPGSPFGIPHKYLSQRNSLVFPP